MDELAVADRVAKGVEVLDRWNPTWPSMINVDKLDVVDGSWCVTAQTAGKSDLSPELLEEYALEGLTPPAGDYTAGLERLGLEAGYDAARHGFNTQARRMSANDDAWFDRREAEASALNAEWRRVIAERLA
jgi:hypothetical protein